MKLADRVPLLTEHDVDEMMKFEPVRPGRAVSLQPVLFQPVPVIVTVVPDQAWLPGTIAGEGGDPLETLRTVVPTWYVVAYAPGTRSDETGTNNARSNNTTT